MDCGWDSPTLVTGLEAYGSIILSVVDRPGLFLGGVLGVMLAVLYTRAIHCITTRATTRLILYFAPLTAFLALLLEKPCV